MKPNKKLGDIFTTTFIGLERDVLAIAENGDIKEEDHITATLFTLARERINKLSDDNQAVTHGLQITARQFNGRGRNSDESFIGADGAVGLRVKLGGVEIQKFCIFQAKKATQKKFDQHAANQRELMLRCTPDSFFLVYSPKDIKFLSAFLVEKDDKFADLPAKSFASFNQDFFNCFIGDHFFGFPDLPYRHPWRYLPYDYPTAKNNLIIEVSDEERKA